MINNFFNTTLVFNSKSILQFQKQLNIIKGFLFTAYLQLPNYVQGCHSFLQKFFQVFQISLIFLKVLIFGSI